MTFLTLDFSYDNLLFAPFADLKAPEGKTGLDLKLEHFPATYAKAFSTMYKALTNETLEPDATIFRLVFKAGRAPKLYGPAIYSKDGKLVIRWGNKVIELDIAKNALLPIGSEADAELFSANIDEVKIGKYREAVINIQLDEYDGFDELVMPFPVKPIDWQEGFNLDKGKQLLKKGNAELVELVAELKMGEGASYANAGDTDGNVYGNDILPQGVDLKVIGARPCKTAHGPSYIFTVAANPEAGLESDVQVWAFSKIRKKLAQGAIVSEAEPGILNFTKGQNEKGETRYKMRFEANWPESEETLSLSSVLATWS